MPVPGSAGEGEGTVSISEASAAFIRGAFPSVWTLELLLLIHSEPDRAWTRDELVEKLRGSRHIVDQGVGALVAGGLVEPGTEGRVRYGPATAEFERLVEDTIRQYRKRPDAVRRIIVFAGSNGLQAFSDAFRLKGD